MANQAGPFIRHPSAIAVWLNHFLRSGYKSPIQVNLTNAITRNQSYLYRSTLLNLKQIYIKATHTGQSRKIITGQRMSQQRHLIQPPKQVGLADSFTSRIINRTNQIITIPTCQFTLTEQLNHSHLCTNQYAA